jgi:hypothetical protein
MGLDNFFVKMCGPGETAEPLRFDPPLELCGGMLSGGDGSFTGHAFALLYADFVGRVSGLDLYADQNRPGELVEAADAIAAWLKDNPMDESDRPDRREVSDLERAFRAYGNAGYWLISWY